MAALVDEGPLTVEYFRQVLGIETDTNDEQWQALVEAANQAVLDAVRAADPNLVRLSETPFYADARNVALLHANGNKLRAVNQRYTDADTVDASYEKKLEVLIKAVRQYRSPRSIQSTQWEEELYRPYGQDFGIGTEIY